MFCDSFTILNELDQSNKFGIRENNDETIDIKQYKAPMKKEKIRSPLLQVRDLITSIQTEQGPITPVNNISFSIDQGKTLGIVGESGCGKSMTALSILNLLPKPQGQITQGDIFFQGTNLRDLSEKALRQIRGRDIGMIFQEPMTALNPVFSIGDQVSEPLRYHQNIPKKIAVQQAIQLLNNVGIPAAEQRINDYPHQLSGGMRQRVMIAAALACKPKLLIADEPTTALDVTIQAQIIDILKRLQAETDMAIMLITHDLGVVIDTCDQVIVMYAGKIVEKASVNDIFNNPQHPYTRGLLASIPDLFIEQEVLDTIPGSVPNLHQLPSGCSFYPRCQQAEPQCAKNPPVLHQINSNHLAACFGLYERHETTHH